MDGEVFFDAPAKVNLSLDIVGRRPDGYHLLETVMLSIPLFDRIGMTISNGTGISLDAPPELMKGNTLIKTARHFRARTGLPEGHISLLLDKQIPVGAGLGGGSADAAALLRGLNDLCGYPLSPSELNALAVEVGADVPFCAIGGCAFCTGIGEVITPLPVPTGFYMIVVKPEGSISTPALYAEYDRIGPGERPDTAAILSALRNGNTTALPALLANCMTLAAETICPDISMIKRKLLALGADGACMSGSGSAVFGIFLDKAAADCAYTTMKQAFRSVHIFSI